jgi:hypothetical protein
VSRPSEWMSTLLLGRFGVQVVGLSCAPPLISASTLPYGVPSRFVQCRAFRSARNDPGLGVSKKTLRVHAARFRGSFFRMGRPCKPAQRGSPWSLSRASLLGLSKISRPSTWLLRVHSRWNRGSTFGAGLPRPALVPPLPFLWASAAYSAPQLAGLLRPAADHRVRHVSSRCFGYDFPVSIE